VSELPVTGTSKTVSELSVYETVKTVRMETRVGERMAEVEEALEDKTAELDEISEALIKSREQFADLISATKRKHWLRRTREYVCNTPHSQKN